MGSPITLLTFFSTQITTAKTTRSPPQPSFSTVAATIPLTRMSTRPPATRPLLPTLASAPRAALPTSTPAPLLPLMMLSHLSPMLVCSPLPLLLLILLLLTSYSSTALAPSPLSLLSAQLSPRVPSIAQAPTVAQPVKPWCSTVPKQPVPEQMTLPE